MDTQRKYVKKHAVQQETADGQNLSKRSPFLSTAECYIMRSKATSFYSTVQNQNSSSILKSYSKCQMLGNSLLMLQMCNVSVVVRVDAELDDSLINDMSETENIIASQWRDVSANEKHELRHKVDEILRPLGLETRLLVMRRANSIALYFICRTLSAVMSLRDQWCSQQLRMIVQELFTLLSTASRTVPVTRLFWPVIEYEQCLEFFSSLQGKAFSYILCTLA